WSMWRSTSMEPLSRWSRAIRRLPNLSALKSVAAPRSVANAIVFPSADQEGSRSAYLSFVRRRRFEPSAFTTNRSERPPSYPVNTSCFPSGDHAGVVARRSEEHTSELQSRGHLVCRLLLEKKKKKKKCNYKTT